MTGRQPRGRMPTAARGGPGFWQELRALSRSLPLSVAARFAASCALRVVVRGGAADRRRKVVNVVRAVSLQARGRRADARQVRRLVVVPVMLIVAYGAARVCSQGFNELRDAVFAKVEQRAVRRLALSTFRHLHALSLRFHLDRRTGGLSRAVERGIRRRSISC